MFVATKTQKKPALLTMTTVLPTTIALRLLMEAALVGKVQRGVERVRFCVVFLPIDGSLVTKFCPFILSPHNQTQIITSSAGALIFVATQPWKKPAMIGEVVPTPLIALRLPMEAALVGKVQRGVERVRFCVVFLPKGSVVTKFCPFILSPHNQT
jgi:hypothetical protein